MGGWTTKGLWKADGSCGRGMQPLSELWPGRESWSISIPFLSSCTPIFWGLLLAEPNRKAADGKDDPEIQSRGQPSLSPGSIAGRRVENESKKGKLNQHGRKFCFP